MICPSCQKQQPMSHRCQACGANLLRRPSASSSSTSGPLPPATAVAVAPGQAQPIVDPGAVAALDNPYASPQSARVSVSLAGTAQRLASRSSRLAAAMLDGIIPLAILLPMFGGLLAGDAPAAGSGGGLGDAFAIGMLISGLLFLAFGVYQISLLVRRGQTIGKKILNIRIVNYDDGQLPPWSKVFGMRYLVNGMLGQFVPLYAILDALFIFGAEQRCVHDYLAGTKVIEA